MDSSENLLLLIDIDGTLLSTNGVAVNYMIKAVENKTGIKVDLDFSDFIGRLDPQIVTTLLKKCGIPSSEAKQHLPAVFNDYLFMLNQGLEENQITVYKGVRDFLNYLLNHNYRFGLLTGNTRRGASIKLKKAGLNHYFRFGAYGDEGETREDLVPVAIHRAEKQYNKKFEKPAIWIIGDSENDIRCARANRINALIVQTGRSDNLQLKMASPEILIEYLDNPQQILSEIIRLSFQN